MVRPRWGASPSSSAHPAAGSRSDSAAWPAALAEARLALSAAERLAQDGCPVRYDQLGVFRLLASVSDSPVLQRYTQESLGPLLAARRGHDLAVTLEAFLDARGSYQEAAKGLG